MTDEEVRVRLCVEAPGVREEGRAVLQPALAARESEGSRGMRSVGFMVLVVLRASEVGLDAREVERDIYAFDALMASRASGAGPWCAIRVWMGVGVGEVLE